MPADEEIGQKRPFIDSLIDKGDYMAVVKSTLDLVMEKTKNMVQTDEERKKARQRERQNLAKGIVLALTEERLTLEELPKAMEEAETEEPHRFKSALIRALVDAVGFDSPGVLTESLNFLTGENGLRLVEGLKNIIDEYSRAEKELTGSVKARLIDELQAAGISGSAVAPNLTVNQTFQAELKELEQEHLPRLDQARDNLKNQADRF